MKIVKWIAGLTGSISLVALLFTIAIQVPTFGLWFYERQYEKNDTFQTVGVEKDDLLGVTKHMLRYMEGKEEELQIETRVNGQLMPFFSDRAVYHMKDVKVLFDVGFIVQKVLFYIVIAVVALFASPLLKKDRKFFYICAASASLFVIISGVIIGMIIAVDFDNAFIVFHHIFFTNDLWRLNHDDRLLNIVPTPFFIDIALLIGISFILSLVAVAIIGIFGAKRKKGGEKH